MKNKRLIKITYFIIAIIILTLIAFYIYNTKKLDENQDPNFCENDSDCTFYNVIGCSNPKAINKKYKNDILSLPENDALCGQIKTKCENSNCIIKINRD